MTDCEIELVPCLSDNYAVLVHHAASGETLLVDAPDAAPIAERLKARGWRLTRMLITHHHPDHVAGIEDLKAESGAEVVGPAAEAARIPGLDRTVRGGDALDLGPFAVEVIDTPGHTLGHVSYHLPRQALAFTGDTLFALGCGRLFEGTPADMWASLQKLATLPPDTTVYCGHEYTLSNARFAVRVDPANALLADRLLEIEALRADGRPTVPTTIARELATNPFMRADSPQIAEALGMAGAAPVEVFAEIRERKNRG